VNKTSFQKGESSITQKKEPRPRLAVNSLAATTLEKDRVGRGGRKAIEGGAGSPAEELFKDTLQEKEKMTAGLCPMSRSKQRKKKKRQI